MSAALHPDSPKARALAAAAAVIAEPTGLVEYRSTGRLLIVGDATRASAAAHALSDKLSVRGIVTPVGAPLPGLDWLACARDEVRVSGWLGSFRADAAGRSLDADLVLDLCEPPLLSMPLKPPGYYAPGADPGALQAALAELPGLVGRFDKPQFFAYRTELCAHGAAEIEGCRRCIDACPAQAIVSVGERVEVNPNLCQGGGGCATVCPTGAITYRYPPAETTLERGRRMLAAFRDAGGERAEILLHAQASPPADAALDTLPLGLEELASAGLETWLALLAYGARAVTLAREPSIPPPSLGALDEQLAVARAILAGMGLPAAVRWSTDPLVAMPVIAPARFAASGGKRQTLFMAIDHLFEAGARTEPSAPLPKGAPLGRIRVDTQGCTLCLSCVSVCPAKALADGGDTPALRLFEGNCVQCGLCAKACPEQVIRLEPRVLYDARLRREATTLHSEEPFRCLRCGKPFATRSMLDRVLAKLSGHRMFQDEASRRRLQMCDNCRVLDMMADDS